MILLKIDAAKALQFARLVDTPKGTYKSVTQRLQGWIDANPGDVNIPIAEAIKLQLFTILMADPKGLEAIIDDFQARGYQDRIYNVATGNLQAFGEVLLKVFNYKSFRKSRKAIWFAGQSGIKSCTTCNTQYTLTTSQPKGEKLLFHLDHYFPKSVYPYLSLSYFNLLPCCASCNMSKSDKPFTLSQNIHPYLDSFHEIAKFRLDPASVLDFYLNPNRGGTQLQYAAKIRARYYGDATSELKLGNYLKEFRIDEQYTQFRDVAAEACLRAKYYGKARRAELKLFLRATVWRLMMSLSHALSLVIIIRTRTCLTGHLPNS